MTIEDRAKQVVTELFEACSADEEGRTRIDGVRVTDIVRRDPEAVSYALQKLLSSPLAKEAGWSIWVVTANTFESEYGDDSLVVLVEAAAAAAGAKLPQVVKTLPHPTQQSEPQNQLVVLEMAEADVEAGDAHRMLMMMRPENFSAEQLSNMLGRSIITFPASGDDRPVQHIGRIRKFMADLHKRMPYFPIYLNFDVRLGMSMIYFGCLGDIAATVVLPDGSVGTNILHPSVLVATKSAIAGIVRECTRLKIDWKPCVEAILSPYDAETRVDLLGAHSA